MKKTGEQLKAELYAPLPSEAIKPHPTKTFLSTIKPIYVTDRLNEVFGIGGWQLRTENVLVNDNGTVVNKIILTVPEYDIYYECFGGNDNGGQTSKGFDLGDAFKGATTDGLTKICSYLGIGIDVTEPIGNMIIDIGGGTTGITVIALAGIVCDQSIRVAGDEFTADIMEALRRYHSLLIGERTAEQIKINVGAAMKDLDNPPDDLPVNGRDLVTGIPKQIMVSYQEIAEALDKSIFKIEEAILKALETTPPELAADIYRRGLYLTGGGALLRGLDKRLSAKIKLPVHVAEDPLKSVVRGTGLALKNYQRFPFIMR
jgi:hypothetical protein